MMDSGVSVFTVQIAHNSSYKESTNCQFYSSLNLSRLLSLSL